MASINITEGIKEINGQDCLICREGFRVSQSFLGRYHLDNGDNYIFRDIPKEFSITSVGELIDYLEDYNNDWKPSQRRYKYEIKPYEQCVNKVLPKLKEWDKDSLVVIFDM